MESLANIDFQAGAPTNISAMSVLINYFASLNMQKTHYTHFIICSIRDAELTAALNAPSCLL